jgi:hypothetical protein
MDDGKYKITIEFIRSMIQWFKDGKTLPRRYAWEIILRAHDHFVKEGSVRMVYGLASETSPAHHLPLAERLPPSCACAIAIACP